MGADSQAEKTIDRFFSTAPTATLLTFFPIVFFFHLSILLDGRN